MEFVGFLKIVVELQLIVRKRLQKSNRKWLQFTFHFLFINSTRENFEPLKNNKSYCNYCRYLVKMTLAVNQIFYKLIFFETLIRFLEPSTIELITEIFELRK